MACKGEIPSAEAGRRGQDTPSQEVEDSRENTNSAKVGSRLDEKVLNLTEPDEGPDYPKGIKLGLIVVSLAMSVFLCALVRVLHSTGFGSVC